LVRCFRVRRRSESLHNHGSGQYPGAVRKWWRREGGAGDGGEIGTPLNCSASLGVDRWDPAGAGMGREMEMVQRETRDLDNVAHVSRFQVRSRDAYPHFSPSNIAPIHLFQDSVITPPIALLQLLRRLRANATSRAYLRQNIVSHEHVCLFCPKGRDARSLRWQRG